MKSSFDTVAVALVLVLGSAAPAFAQGGSLNSPTAAPPPPPPPSSMGLKGELAGEATPPPPPSATAPEAPPEGTAATPAVAPPPTEEAAAEEAGGEEEEEPPVTFSIEVPVATSYVWRGTLLSSSRFKPVLQPYVELGFNGLGPGTFTVGGWFNQSLTEDDNEANREVDVYASYAIPVASALELKLGYIVYLLPVLDPVDSQHEFSAVATFDTGGGFSPYIGVHVDPIRLNGAYAQVGAEYAIEAGSASIVPALNAGVSKYEEVEFDLQDVTLSLRLDVPFGESGLYATATAAAALNGRAVEGDDKILPYGLLGVGFSN